MTTYWLLGENKTGTGTAASVMPEEQLPGLACCSSTVTSTAITSTSIGEKKELPVITFTSTIIGNDSTKPSILNKQMNFKRNENDQDKRTK